MGGYSMAEGSDQGGYRQSGDWWNGYRGVSTFRPEQYNIDRQAADTGQQGSYLWGQGQQQYNRGFGSAGGFMRGQEQLAGYLGQRAMGAGGPSAAELQLQQGLGRAQQGAMGLASSVAGTSPALAMRRAMQAQSAMAAQTQQQASVLRAQEQLAAQQALGNLLGQARGQSLQEGQFGYGQMAGQMEADRAARMAMEGMYANQNQAFQQMLMNQSIQNAGNQNTQGMMGATMSALGAVGGGLLSGWGGAAGAAAQGANALTQAGRVNGGGYNGGLGPMASPAPYQAPYQAPPSTYGSPYYDTSNPWG